MPAPPAVRKQIAGLLSGAPKGGSLPMGLLGRQGAMSSYTPTMREKMAGLLAKGWFGDTREGYRQAGNLVNVGENVTPLGLLTMGDDAYRAAGKGNYLEAGLLGGLAMMPLPPALKKGAAKGIRAFHGSPHSFDKFSMDMIGTGEGAQAYGHGLYFAEGERVAKSYRENLTGPPTEVYFPNGDVDSRFIPDELTDPVEQAAASALLKYSSSLGYKQALRKYQIEKDIAVKAMKMIKNKQIARADPGHMYEVNIDADPDQFLDWDKPLSEQPENVRKSLIDVLPSTDGKTPLKDVMRQWEDGGLDTSRMPEMKYSGQDIYHKLKSDQIKQAGIPGIKYLDAGSRAKGDGSHNYVVFDENLISIVRKYGIAGASAMLGYDVLENVTTDQAETLKQAQRVY